VQKKKLIYEEVVVEVMQEKIFSHHGSRVSEKGGGEDDVSGGCWKKGKYGDEIIGEMAEETKKERPKMTDAE
jgi:hypothetical protein